MGIAFKDKTEMAKAGIILDPNNQNAAVPVAGLHDLQPDSSWSDERLIEYGQRALNAVDKYEEQATILTRKSIVRRFQAGHALSLLKSRHRNQGTWVEFQSQHNLPRTVVWETIAVYEQVVQQGHGEDDVAQHATWAAVMIAYGVKRNHQETISDIPPDATDQQPDVESFTRETSSGEVGDISVRDDQAVLAGVKKECEEIRALDSNYPAQYHRLGTFIIEACKRFGDENVKQSLRQEGIDNTRAWRAEQIAKLYTYDQAVEFPSLRAILTTLPAKQPRNPKAKLKGGGDHQATEPQKPHHIPQEVVSEETIVARFIRIGIEVRELFGDEEFDQAIEQIRNHTSETFEQVFVEVC
jgi:hypothetical protein